MSNNLADFLNDNTGVVGAAAGLAVNRKLAASNQNLSALRRDLRQLQDKQAQEKAKDERERLNREMLFQVRLQVDAVRKGEHSANLHFEALRVSNDFNQLGFRSATFNALQDKTFLNDVAASIEETLSAIWQGLTNENKQQISEVLDWHYLKELGEAIAIADEKIPYAVDLLQKKVQAEERNNPKSSGSIFARILGLEMKTERDSQEATKSVETMYVPSGTARGYLQNHIRDLRTHRARCCVKLSSIQSVPEETVSFMASDSADLNERFEYLLGVGKHVSEMCSALDVDPMNLPTPVERQDKGGHLSTREHLSRWWKPK